jgi:hypothetical protein
MQDILARFTAPIIGLIRVTANTLFAPGIDEVDLTCNAARRHAIRARSGGAGVADTIEVCQKDAADAYGWEAVASIELNLVGSNTATWNPGAIANGSGASTTIAVTGALTTDYVLASHSGSRTNNFIDFYAFVSSADTITAWFWNNLGGSVTVGSGTLSVKVLR